MSSLLLREAIGASIRRVRTSQQRSLREVSRRARVSLGYLSEVERGRKEASSELLAAICEALGLPLPELLDDAAMLLRPIAIRQAPIGNNHADLRLADSRRVPTPAGAPRVADAA